MKLEVLTRTPVAQNGTLASSSAVVTGLASTTALAPGMAVTGTGVAAGATVAAVDSASQVTLSAAATASGSQALAFALVEPVTLAAAKLHLRVDFTTDDDLIAALVTAARETCEREVRRAVVTRTFLLTLDRFPFFGYPQPWPWLGATWEGSLDTWRYLAIYLPVPPLVSVASVKYYDLAGTLQTLDPSLYTVSAGTPGRIVPAPLSEWPVPRSQPDAVQITFTAGYAPAADVPSYYAPAIKLLVGSLYENREAIVVGTGIATVDLSATVQALLANGFWGGYG